MVVFLAVINTILLVIGQSLFKIGVLKINVFKFDIRGLFSVISNGYILTGIVVYGFTTFLWLYILSKASLSYVYPIQSLAFVFAMFSSVFFLNENVRINNWIGVALICLGVMVSSMKV